MLVDFTKDEPVLERCAIKRFLFNSPLNSTFSIKADKFGIYQKQQCNNILYLDLLAIDDKVIVVRYPDGNSALVDPPLESAIRLRSYVSFEIKDKMNIVVVVKFKYYDSDINVCLEFEDLFNTFLVITEHDNFANIAEPLTVAYI